MARLSLTLLGGFQARLDPGGAASLPTKKAQALLAYLALPLGRAHPRDKLAALLWGGIREESARNSLRQAIFALRKALTAADPPSLRLDGDLVALDPAAVEVDVVVFERAAAEATPAALERAAALYQGDFLAGLGVDEVPFEEWLLGERERLRELALEGLAKLLAHQRKAGATEAAIQTSIKLLTLDPLQEPVHRTLMRLYAEERRRGAALRQYQTCVGILQRELGVEPETETKALYQEILRQRPSDRTGGRELARQPPRGARAEAVTTETPLIGRDVELATLGTMLAEAGSGRGRAVAILGEAGVGKSRLLTEVATQARARGSHVLFGRSYESAQILPFGPWVDAFRTGGLIAEETMLSGLNPIWRAELARLFPELAGPGLPAASDDYLRLFESVAALVAHIASTKPLVLMLEDLHWADEMSLRLLSFLGRRVSAWPVLMVATAREEELADADALRRALGELRGEGHFDEVMLSPLSRPDTSRLVRVLTVAGSEARTVARLEEQAWAASEGNPFVVVETVRALREGLTLREPANLSLPQRVRDVIVGRVERLSEGSRQLLSVAAVIGREFDFALLQRASRLTDRDAAGSVEELVRRRMLHGVDEGFDFTHDRIREVVYGGLLPPRRKLLHGDVGAALEALTVGALDPPAAALGMHYRHAEAWDKAVLYLRQAGLKAAARSAHRDAVACFEQALEALTQLPERRETLEEAVDLRYDLRNALLPLADHAAIFEHLDAADALARRLGDDQRLGRVACYRCLSFSAIGEHEQAIAAGHRALVLSTAAGVFDVEVVAQTYLGMTYYAIGDFPQALDFSRKARASLTGERRYARFGQVNLPAVSSGVHVAWSLAELGDFAEGGRVAEEIVLLAETTEQPYIIAAALRAAGLLYRRQGELPRAIAALERGLALCQSAGIQIFFPQIASILAMAYALAGRTVEAVPILDQMLERVATGTRFLNVALVLVELSEALLLIGRVDDASPLVGRLLEMSRTHSARGYQAHALRLQGELAGRRDPLDIDQAAAHYREALALAEPSGMRPLVAHCHLGLGKLSRRLGKGEEMEQHLRIATTMYREMGMQFWLYQAEAEEQEQRPGVSGARRAGRAPA